MLIKCNVRILILHIHFPPSSALVGVVYLLCLCLLKLALFTRLLSIPAPSALAALIVLAAEIEMSQHWALPHSAAPQQTIQTVPI